jgi:hypothetical protein
MNVKLAAQTLSFSVKLNEFQGSAGTVKFVRKIDRLFDIMNSRNP